MATSRKGIGTAGKGRPLGVPNKNPLPPELKQQCQAACPGVVEFWIKTYLDITVDLKYRLIAAAKLVEYGHGLPTQSIEQHNTGDLAVIWVNEWRKRGGDK